MPLLTAQDFPQIFAQPDESGLARGISQAFGYVRDDRLRAEAIKRADEQQAQELQREKNKEMLAGRGRMYNFAASIEDPNDQRAAIVRMAKTAEQRGEPVDDFMSILDTPDPDQLRLNIAIAAKRLGDKLDQVKLQFGGQDLFEDEDGNKFYGTSRRDPSSGEVDPVLTPLPGNKSNTPVGELSRVSGTGLTPSGKVAQVQEIEEIKTTEEKERVEDKLEVELEKKPALISAEKQASAAVSKAEAAFSQIDKIRANTLNLRNARQAVIDGAGTGPLLSLLPSFREQSILLDSAQGRLGLDIVQSTTFGALSKGELDLSKAIALPKALKGDALVDWIDRKLAANDKMANYLERQAVFLSETDEEGKPNTLADWKKAEKAALNTALEAFDVTEEDIKETMRANGMDRSAVLSEIRRRFESGGS